MDEQTKERIIQFNKRFGLNTEFITDENILGYALGNSIYINSNLKHDMNELISMNYCIFLKKQKNLKKLNENCLRQKYQS